jgi:hypothetical protein
MKITVLIGLLVGFFWRHGVSAGTILAACVVVLVALLFVSDSDEPKGGE